MDQDIPIAERLQTDSAVRLQKQLLYKRWAIASIVQIAEAVFVHSFSFASRVRTRFRRSGNCLSAAETRK